MKSRSIKETNDVLSPDFLDFIRCLDRNRVECVLVGGYALAVYGVIRATGDIDFFYRPTEANVRRLCEALRDFGAPGNVIDRDALRKPDIVTQFGEPPFRIDLLNAIDGVTFERAWSGAMQAEIEGSKIRIIGRADLCVNKLATGRSKDRDDARKLTPQKERKNRRAN